jgi:SRSO17 transposase
MIAETTLGDAVLGLDETGLPKQGKASVGVARQYSGTLGKVGNCQLAITCCNTDLQATWPVAVRLRAFAWCLSDGSSPRIAGD